MSNDTKDEIPTATHEGELTIGGITMRIYNLDNGKRVVDANDMNAFLMRWLMA
jgi:hypothetical protein